MISEVTPRGKEFLFFSLFSIVGKTSSFIGPLVSSAIIDDTVSCSSSPFVGRPTGMAQTVELTKAQGNNSSPFYFLFALSIVSFLFLLFFVDLKKSREEQAIFLERERLAKAKKRGEDADTV